MLLCEADSGLETFAVTPLIQDQNPGVRDSEGGAPKRGAGGMQSSPQGTLMGHSW